MDDITKWIISEYARLEIGNQLQGVSDGEYTIPNLSVADINDERLYMANYLTINLSKEFPDFVFWKTEKLFPQPGDGVTIKWRKKVSGVSAYETYRGVIDAEYKANDEANRVHELETTHVQELVPEYTLFERIKKVGVAVLKWLHLYKK